MPRARLPSAVKLLRATRRPVRENLPDPGEYRVIWTQTLARRAEATRRLAEVPPAEWASSPLHQIIDRSTSQLVRMAGLMNFAVTVAQRPAEAEGNPWAGFRVVRGGPRKPPDARKVV